MKLRPAMKLRPTLSALALWGASSVLALAACNMPMVVEPEQFDSRGNGYTEVKSAVDERGGELHDVIVMRNRNGGIDAILDAHGPGTGQTVGTALAGSLPMAAGFVGGEAVRRPDTTNVSQTGGGASGGAVSVGSGAVTAAANAAPVNVAKGGSASASGGNATSSAASESSSSSASKSMSNSAAASMSNPKVTVDPVIAPSNSTTVNVAHCTPVGTGPHCI